MSEKKQIKNKESTDSISIKAKDTVDQGSFNDDGNEEGMNFEYGKRNNGDGGSIKTEKASVWEGNIPILGYKESNKYKIRLFVSNNAFGEYVMFLKSDKDYEKCYLGVKISGEQSNIGINVLRADLNNNIKLKCEKNIIFLHNIKCSQKNKIVFKLDDEEIYSLEVRLYEG